MSTDFKGFVKFHDKDKLERAVCNYTSLKEKAKEAYKCVKELTKSIEVKRCFGLSKTNKWEVLLNNTSWFTSIYDILAKEYHDTGLFTFSDATILSNIREMEILSELKILCESEVREVYLTFEQLAWVEKYGN